MAIKAFILMSWSQFCMYIYFDSYKQISLLFFILNLVFQWSLPDKFTRCEEALPIICEEPVQVPEEQLLEELMPDVTEEPPPQKEHQDIVEETLPQNFHDSYIANQENPISEIKLPTKQQLSDQVSAYNCKHQKEKCLICCKLISKKNLSRHYRTHKGLQKRTVICVDQQQGLFLVDPQIQGGAKPLHVLARTFGAKSFACSGKDCQLMLGPSARGRKNFMCDHILSALNSSTDVDHLPLDDISEVIMSAAMKEKVQQLHANATKNNSPLIVKYPDSTFAQYYSVYCGINRYWCLFGRTLVTLKDDKLLCPCSGSRNNCVHKAALRWALGLNVNLRKDEEAEAATAEDFQESASLNSAWHSSRFEQRITDQHILEFDLSTEWSNLVPKEETCTMCGSGLQMKLITKSGQIVDHSFIKKGLCSFYWILLITEFNICWLRHIGCTVETQQQRNQ